MKFYLCKVKKEMVGREGKERGKEKIGERVDRKKKERKRWAEEVAQLVKYLQCTQVGRSLVQVPRTHIKPKTQEQAPIISLLRRHFPGNQWSSSLVESESVSSRSSGRRCFKNQGGKGLNF